MKENNTESCSALILNYNHGNYIHNTINSMINQTLPFDQILIIDDCSTDKSVEIISKLISKKKNMTLIKNTINTGVIANLNKGTELLKSKYIYFVSADDDYNTNIVKAFEEAISLYPNIAMISGNVSRRKANANKSEDLILPFKTFNNLCDPTIYSNTAKQRVVTFFGGGNIIRRDLILSLGGFEKSLEWCADWFLYQLIGLNEKVCIKNDFFMTINISKDSFSQSSFNWRNNQIIIINFLNMIIKKQPQFFKSFKDNAILPFYDVRILFIILSNKSYQKILTPLLLWRLISYDIFKQLNYVVPKKWHLTIRKLLKV